MGEQFRRGHLDVGGNAQFPEPLPEGVSPSNPWVK